MFLSLEKNILDTSIIEAAKRVDNSYRLHLKRSEFGSISTIHETK